MKRNVPGFALNSSEAVSEFRSDLDADQALNLIFVVLLVHVHTHSLELVESEKVYINTSTSLHSIMTDVVVSVMVQILLCSMVIRSWGKAVHLVVHG